MKPDRQIELIRRIKAHHDRREHRGRERDTDERDPRVRDAVVDCNLDQEVGQPQMRPEAARDRPAAGAHRMSLDPS